MLAAIWGGSFPLMRVAVPELGAFAVAFVRVAVGALVLLPLVLFRGSLRALIRDTRSLVFVGVTGAAMPFALFAYAAFTVPSGVAAVLNATAPTFTALIASLWMNEKMSRTVWAGMGLGLLGVAVLVSDRVSLDSLGAIPAMLACLLAASLYAVSVNFTRARLRSVDPLVVAAGMQTFAALALAPLALATWSEEPASTGAWVCALVLGLVCTGFALIVYFGLVQRVGPSRAVTVTFLVPVFGMLFGAVFLGEQLSLTMLVGAVIVLVGTAMAVGVVGARRRETGV